MSFTFAPPPKENEFKTSNCISSLIVDFKGMGTPIFIMEFKRIESVKILLLKYYTF